MALVGTVVVRTNLTPPIFINPSIKGGDSWFLKLIKPTVDGEIVGQQVHYAPFGDASEDTGTYVIAGLAVLLLLGVAAVLKKVLR